MKDIKRLIRRMESPEPRYTPMQETDDGFAVSCISLMLAVFVLVVILAVWRGWA
jgi:hypothetical protein